MRIVVCVKWVPTLGALRFDAATRRLAREGVPGEVSAFDLRALGSATALRDAHGGEVVVVTMGPPGARDGLVECLALGADRAVLATDPAFAGADTLATARVLAAAVSRERPDLVLFGRASTDAETGQVGPEVAELLGLAQATSVRRLEVDPTAGTFTAEREADDGYETLVGPLPAVVTAAEDLAEECFPTKAGRAAAAEKPVATVDARALGVASEDVGAAGSPTSVAGLQETPVTRRGERIPAEAPAEAARLLGERLRAIGRPPDATPTLPPPRSDGGVAVLVVAEAGSAGVRAVTAELLAKAASLAPALGGVVEALVIGDGREHASALAAAGADRVLVAEGGALAPYTTDAHASALVAAITARTPRLVLLASTARGRDLAPRVAARLGLGLTGDAIDLDVDDAGRVRQMKPAFGGSVVAPILSRTRPEMATVRPGVLPAARADASRPVRLESLVVPDVPARVRVTAEHRLDDTMGARLEAADVVLGVGRGIGGPEALPPILELATHLGAAVAATREVTDAGWLPKQCQVGMTGRTIAPRLYVALAVSGAMEHVVGIRRAGVVVAINTKEKAPIFRAADLGIVADYRTLLPHLARALR